MAVVVAEVEEEQATNMGTPLGERSRVEQATRVSSVCLTMKPCTLKRTLRQQLPHAQGFLGVTPRAPRGKCPRGGEEAGPRRRVEREEEEEEEEEERKGLDGRWG